MTHLEISYWTTYFPLGNDLIPSVKVDLHRFKIAPPNIVYQPFLDIHKDKIKKRITQYNKFDTKVPVFVILKDPKNQILPRKLKKWEDIQNHQFLIIGGQHTIVVTKVHFICMIVLL
jgi:hypothetical protein